MNFFAEVLKVISNSHIEIRVNSAGIRRAYIVGTRIRVQDIYADSELHGMTPDEIAAGYPQLTLAQVHAALAYYFDHAEEIKSELCCEQDLVRDAKERTGPGPLERKLRGAEAPRDSVSSG